MSASKLMSVIELKLRKRLVRLVRFWIPTRLVIPACSAANAVSPDTKPQVAPTESAARIAASRVASSNVAMASSGCWLWLQRSLG